MCWKNLRLEPHCEEGILSIRRREKLRLMYLHIVNIVIISSRSVRKYVKKLNCSFRVHIRTRRL